MKMKRRYAAPIAVLVLSCLVFLLLSYLSCETISRMASSLADADTPVIYLDQGTVEKMAERNHRLVCLKKDINLSITLKLKTLLETAGYRVKMTREEDCSIGDNTLPTVRERKVSDIHKRLELVEAEQNCILVSIHQNYFTQSRYSGAQIFYSPIMRIVL